MRPDQFFKGVKGLVKSSLGIDLASEETIKKRKEVCYKCEYLIKQTFLKCGICKCYISAKVRIKSESCPKGFW